MWSMRAARLVCLSDVSRSVSAGWRAAPEKEAQAMLRRQGKKEPPKAEPKDSISRQEAVIWLGRAMSTNEITLRVMLELLDVVAFQQAQLKNLTEHDTAG